MGPGAADETVFDYIVVGAGSAGAVIARRLVDAGRRVLLVEAGPPDSLPEILPRTGFALPASPTLPTAPNGTPLRTPR